MRIWSTYSALASAMVFSGLGIAASLAPEHAGAFLLAGLVALGVQLIAFAPVVALRRQPYMLLAAWAGGVLLRMGALLVVGLWLVGGGPYAATPALLALAATLTVLAMIEPLALRRAARSSAAVG